MRNLRGYEVVEQIGSGAFATVWRSRQPSVDRDVAIKEIRAELATQPEFVRRFEAEAQIVARLQHPSIVPLVDFWRDSAAAYLVMQYMSGGTLEQRLDDGPLSVDATSELLAQIGGALSAAHARGIVHRDVKSANILFDRYGFAYLSDFGIAFVGSDGDDSAAALSPGTPMYASPEQLRREPADQRTDVFSLGIVAYECLAGSLPFADLPAGPELFHHQLNEPLPRLAEAHGVASAVSAAVARAIEKRPEDRFESVEAFVDAFTGDGRKQLQVEIHNPYLGLRPFGEADADRFFGRDRLVSELVSQMATPGLTERSLVLVGGSGSGKSSVVRAGLLPALRAGAITGSDRWFVTTMTPQDDPIASVAEALGRVAVVPSDEIEATLRSGPRGLLRAARHVAGAGQPVLLVIDQLEELFTGESDPRMFLDSLAAAVNDPSGQLRVVATLRADFYDRPLAHPRYAHVLKQTAVDVTPLAADELERAIVGPAQLAGLELEAGLLGRIVADSVGEAAPLPLLQYLLSELADRAIDGQMTVAAFDELGGIEGALASTAERIHTACSPVEQAAMRRVLGLLAAPAAASSGDVRRRVHLADLVSDPVADSVTHTLAEARLVTFDRDPTSREPVVEVAHEALLRRWPRLVEWLEEDRASLRQAAVLAGASDRWDTDGRAEADLLRGARLEAAHDLVERRVDLVRPLDEQLVRASLTEQQRTHDAQVRQVRSLRRRLAVTVLGLVVAVAAGIIANDQRRRANDEAARAESEALRAEAEEVRAEQEAGRAASSAQVALTAQRRAEDAARDLLVTSLISQATQVALTEPQRAALLSLHAHRIRPDRETSSGIFRTLLEAGAITDAYAPVVQNDEETCQRDGAVSSDGLSQYASIEGRRVEIDVVSGERVDRGQLLHPCNFWSPSADRTRVVEIDPRTDALSTIDADGNVLATLSADENLAGLAFNLDGPPRALLGVFVGANSEAAHLYDAVTGEIIAGPYELVRPLVEFSPDGTLMLMSSATVANPDGGGPLVLVDADTGAELWRVETELRGQVVAFDRPAKRLILGRFGAVEIRDLDTGELKVQHRLRDVGDIAEIGVRGDGLIVVMTTARVELVHPEHGLLEGEGIDISDPVAMRLRPDDTLLVHTTDHHNRIYAIDGGGALGRVVQTNSANSWVDYNVGIISSVDIGTGLVDVVDVDTGDSYRFDPIGPDGTRITPIAGGATLAGTIVTVSIDGTVATFRQGELVSAVEASSFDNPELIGGTGDDGLIALVFTEGFQRFEVVLVASGAEVEVLYRFQTETPPLNAVASPGGGVFIVDESLNLVLHDETGAVVERFEVPRCCPDFGARDEQAGMVVFAGIDGGFAYDVFERQMFEISQRGIVNVEVVLDGSAVVLGRRDGVVELWDLETDASIATLADFDANVLGNPTWDAERGTVWFPAPGLVAELPLTVDAWTERACRIAGGEFDEAAWAAIAPEQFSLEPVCP